MKEGLRREERREIGERREERSGDKGEEERRQERI
jgi:hypothetical protein